MVCVDGKIVAEGTCEVGASDGVGHEWLSFICNELVDTLKEHLGMPPQMIHGYREWFG